MAKLHAGIALWPLGALAVLVGCNGLIGVRDIFLDDAGPSTNLDASMTSNGGDGSFSGTDSGPNSADAGLADQRASDSAGDAPACPNTTTDPLNCGACGHDCLGGSCAGGVCGAAKMITAQGEPWTIAVDGTNIYWSDISGGGGTLYKMPKLATLGAPVVLATTVDDDVYGMVIDATYLYFSSGLGAAGLVERVALDGGAKQTVTSTTSPQGLSIDSTRVYWSSSDTPTDVMAATKMAGAGAVEMAPTEKEPGATFVDGDFLYWTTDTAVRRCALPSCANRADMIPNLNGPLALATNATLLFYTVGDGIFQIAKNAPPGQGAAVASGQPQPYAIAADDKDVVWVNLGLNGNGFADGDIRRCPIVSGTAQCNGMGEILAADPKMPRGIAMDAKAIYWTSQNEGTIYRLAR